MIAAQTEAKRFIRWLEKYNHHEGYDNLGQAIHSWCVADDGLRRLGFDYAQLLQMVTAVLVTAKSPLRVGTHANKHESLNLPTAFDGWLPDRDDCAAAIEEIKARDASRNS